LIFNEPRHDSGHRGREEHDHEAVGRLGSACAEYQDAVLVDLPCKRIECDEIWSFCYAKQKNVPWEHRDEFGYGDVWT
jgi:hypothetical protein